MSNKLSSLKPFKAPPPVEKEACAACEAFAPECLVPVGDAAVPMCWLCAHHVIEHGTAPHHAHAAECECTPREIYPNRTPPLRLEHGDVDYSKKRDPKDYLTGHLYNPRTKCIDTIVRGSVVASAPLVPTVREERSRRKPT